MTPMSTAMPMNVATIVPVRRRSSRLRPPLAPRPAPALPGRRFRRRRRATPDHDRGRRTVVSAVGGRGSAAGRVVAGHGGDPTWP